MCTVSFVKVEGKVIITSNRDERVLRPSAEPPKMYHLNNTNVIYPKDPQAGGTWYAVGDNGTILVLLNGANEKHIVKGPYRLSRGLIVLDIISQSSPKDFWSEIDLDNIEPFTIVLFQNEALYQLRWNGLAKEKIVLDTAKKHIWSSSPLYSAAIRKEREVLFYAALQNKAVIDEQAMYQFHRYTDIEDVENGLVINRDNNLKTLSITQAVIKDNKISMLYYDLISQRDYATSFLIENNK
jgi:hypothetical protein